MLYLLWLTQSYTEIKKLIKVNKDPVFVDMQEEIKVLGLEIVEAHCENSFNKVEIRFEKINIQFGKILKHMQEEENTVSKCESILNKEKISTDMKVQKMKR